MKRLAMILLLALPAPALAELRPATAVDGDTLRVDGALVRIMGLDTPELRRARCAAELDLARRATQRMAALIAGGVSLDVAPRRDRYGRVLAVVRGADGRDVAPVMIREHLAREYHGRGKRAGWCE